MMNIIVASRLRAVVETNINTIIGGAASEITTAQAFADLSSLSPSEITNFEIVGDDIQMFITTDYFIVTRFHVNNPNPLIGEKLTCFIDFDGHFQSNFQDRVFENTNIKLIHTPLNNSINLREVSTCLNLKIFNSPVSTPVGGTSLNDEVFNRGTNCEFYTNIANETVNSGSPDEDITELLINGGSVVYKDLNNTNQTTAPPSPTIIANTIGGFYVELNVSQPTHVNTLKHALVFVNGVFNSIWEIDNVFAINLEGEKTYSLKVIITDEYFNISPYSDVINITTQPLLNIFQNLLIYLKLNETQGQVIDLARNLDVNINGPIARDGEYYEYTSSSSFLEIKNGSLFNFTNGEDFVVKTEVIFESFGSFNFAPLFAKRLNNTERDWQFSYISGNLEFAIWDENGNEITPRPSFSFNPTMGQKYILGATFSNNILKIFADGVVLGSQSIDPTKNFRNSDTNIVSGSLTFINGLNFLGKQKESLIIRGFSWTDADILNNYNNGNGTTI